MNNIPTVKVMHAPADVETSATHAKCPSASRVEAFPVIHLFLQYSDRFFCKSTSLVQSGRPGLKRVVMNRRRNKKTPEVDMQKCKLLQCFFYFVFFFFFPLALRRSPKERLVPFYSSGGKKGPQRTTGTCFYIVDSSHRCADPSPFCATLTD